MKNYQGRNERAVFLPRLWNVSWWLPFTIVRGDKTEQSFEVNIIPVFELRKWGLTKLKLACGPVAGKVQSQTGSLWFQNLQPMSFVSTTPHCLEAVQQARRVGPVLGVSYFTWGSFHFWLNVFKGLECSCCLRGRNYGFIVSATLALYHRLWPEDGSGAVFSNDLFIQTSGVMASAH